jgi:hemoglobin
MTSNTRRIRTTIAACLLAAALPAPAQESPAGGATLYGRMGGNAVISAVVDETVETMAANPRVNQSYEKVDLKRLKSMVVEQICALAGGPCRYSGDDMKTTHAGLNITESEFYAQVEALRAALDHHGVGTREKNELLRMLAPMKRDVVTK